MLYIEPWSKDRIVVLRSSLTGAESATSNLLIELPNNYEIRLTTIWKIFVVVVFALIRQNAQKITADRELANIHLHAFVLKVCHQRKLKYM